MPEGGCFCNKIRVSFTGEPAGHALCHCQDCRKISGGTYSNNMIIPENNFKLVSGTPKQISKTADSGKHITSNFCPDCGTTLFRTGESFPQAVVLKIGVLDDVSTTNSATPKAELWAPSRPSWIPAVEGAAQVDEMPPS